MRYFLFGFLSLALSLPVFAAQAAEPTEIKAETAESSPTQIKPILFTIVSPWTLFGRYAEQLPDGGIARHFSIVHPSEINYRFKLGRRPASVRNKPTPIYEFTRWGLL